MSAATASARLRVRSTQNDLAGGAAQDHGERAGRSNRAGADDADLHVRYGRRPRRCGIHGSALQDDGGTEPT